MTDTPALTLQEDLNKVLLGSPNLDPYEAAEAVWAKQNERIKELTLKVANLELANEEARKTIDRLHEKIPGEASSNEPTT